MVTECSVLLETGDYDLSSEGLITISDEPWVPRLITHVSSSRDRQFRMEVRQRDGKCVISGLENRRADLEDWRGFDACHIVPLHLESWLVQQHYDSWITDETSSAKINSPQNGLLLSSSVHQDFDAYIVSVNPDDGYKIFCFSRDNLGVDGRILDPVCLDPNSEHCVPDQLLRWHFRQSVLANMRGDGEPIFEHDYPPGTDQITEMQGEPMAQVRFELLLADRLRDSEYSPSSHNEEP
ncbi:hypothetical protein TWF696_006303 [Orbilia brochopaga]|uniref:HNH nuclease domain-containing protein n=1 Tax=Orbilia brochopaga TaxID=3140254 RepID=A0AAV9UYY1_9PEZI